MRKRKREAGREGYGKEAARVRYGKEVEREGGRGRDNKGERGREK